MNTNPFSLQSHIDLLFDEVHRETAVSPPLVNHHANRTKSEILYRLGLANRAPAPLNVTLTQVVHQPGYSEEHLILDAGEQVQIPMVVLVPNGLPPFKPILLFHGHEPGAAYVLGHYPDAETEAANLASDNNYAQALAQAGFLVCVVEQRGLGQRLTNQVEDRGYPCSCRHLAFSYMMLGRTLVGERCWDGICALDYLQTRADIVPGVVGCTGHSGGGCTALWLSLLDERITAVAVSGYFNAFTASILAMRHCECNYIPGLLALGEMGDWAALMAPRPLCIIHGEQDDIYPAEAAQAQFAKVAEVYAASGNAAACQLHIHDGGHAYHLPTSLAWFEAWL